MAGDAMGVVERGCGPLQKTATQCVWADSLGSVLQAGDFAVICDDFAARMPSTKGDRRVLPDFARGWQIHSLLSIDALVRAAGEAGFRHEEDRDLTSNLRLWTLKDRALSVLVGVFRPLGLSAPWWLNFLGGSALQRGLARGRISYRYVRLRKS